MRTVIDGVTAGLVGAITVAGWFLMLDVDRGHAFATPALLGSVLLQGTRHSAQLGAVASPVIEYTVVHFAAFLLFGLAASWLIAAAEREPHFTAGVLILFLCFEVFFLLLIGAVSHAVLAMLVWWRIVTANLLASAAMYGFFAVRHPSIAEQFKLEIHGSGAHPTPASSR